MTPLYPVFTFAMETEGTDWEDESPPADNPSSAEEPSPADVQEPVEAYNPFYDFATYTPSDTQPADMPQEQQPVSETPIVDYSCNCVDGILRGAGCDPLEGQSCNSPESAPSQSCEWQEIKRDCTDTCRRANITSRNSCTGEEKIESTDDYSCTNSCPVEGPPQNCPNWQETKRECNDQCHSTNIVSQDSCNGQTKVEYAEDYSCTDNCPVEGPPAPEPVCSPNWQVIKEDCTDECHWANVTERDSCSGQEKIYAKERESCTNNCATQSESGYSISGCPDLKEVKRDCADTCHKANVTLRDACGGHVEIKAYDDDSCTFSCDATPTISDPNTTADIRQADSNGNNLVGSVDAALFSVAGTAVSVADPFTDFLFSSTASGPREQQVSDCFTTECDPNLGEKVCMEQWVLPDELTSYTKPGRLAGEKCESKIDRLTYEATGVSCETKRINECLEQVCDPNLNEEVCLEQWETRCQGGSTPYAFTKPGQVTGKRCGVATSNICAPKRLQECAYTRCDPDLGTKVCMEIWTDKDSCSRVAENDRPGAVTDQPCSPEDLQKAKIAPAPDTRTEQQKIDDAIAATGAIPIELLTETDTLHQSSVPAFDRKRIVVTSTITGRQIELWDPCGDSPTLTARNACMQRLQDAENRDIIITAAAGAAIPLVALGGAVVAPMVVPVAASVASIPSSVAAFMGTTSTAAYVYITTTGQVLISKAPPVVQSGLKIGAVAAENGDYIMDAAAYTACLAESDFGVCAERHEPVSVMRGGGLSTIGAGAESAAGTEAKAATKTEEAHSGLGGLWNSIKNKLGEIFGQGGKTAGLTGSQIINDIDNTGAGVESTANTATVTVGGLTDINMAISEAERALTRSSNVPAEIISKITANSSETEIMQILRDAGYSEKEITSEFIQLVRNKVDEDLAKALEIKTPVVLNGSGDELPVIDGAPKSGTPNLSNSSLDIKFYDDPQYQIVLGDGTKFTVSPQAYEFSRPVVALRSEEGKVVFLYKSESENTFKIYSGEMANANNRIQWVAKYTGELLPEEYQYYAKIYENAPFEVDKALKQMVDDGRVKFTPLEGDKQILDALDQVGMAYTPKTVSKAEGDAARAFLKGKGLDGRWVDMLSDQEASARTAMVQKVEDFGVQASVFDQSLVKQLDIDKPVEVVSNGLRGVNLFYEIKGVSGETIKASVSLNPIPGEYYRAAGGSKPLMVGINFGDDAKGAFLGGPGVVRTGNGILPLGQYEEVERMVLNSDIGKEMLRLANNDQIPTIDKPFLLTEFAQNHAPASVRGVSAEAKKITVLKTDSVELEAKKMLVGRELKKTGKLDADFVNQLAKVKIIKSNVKKFKEGYNLMTGKDGRVKAVVEKGRYFVSVDHLPGIDITVPSVIDATKASSVILPVRVKKGSGAVKKTSYKEESKNSWGIVYADEKKDDNKPVLVKAGILSELDDKVVPWAKLNIKLEKVDVEKDIRLNAGWNLVTLTALPQKAFTASGLIGEINKQDGQATTVSTLVDGAWKTYVARGDKSYTGEDFAIEPGKAYFVKALQKSTFTFTGQNFVVPVNVKLSSGWNAVGLPFMSKNYKASDLAGATSADTAARWESGLWDTLVLKDKQKYGEDFVISNNRGYILKVGKESEFSP